MGHFLNRFIGKETPGSITFDDFLEFYKQKVDEHLNLEYQPKTALVNQQHDILQPKSPDEIVGYAAIARSVVSFANSDGGLLVLGVKSKVEKYKGQVVRISPGQLSMLPPNITPQSLQHSLLARIQFPIENLTIVQVNKSDKSSDSVFLIDVPASTKAPHRVNERYYYQRLNFSTFEMQHYQIADLFHRRTAPVVKAAVNAHAVQVKHTQHFLVNIVLVNLGQDAAKHLTCICRVHSNTAKSATTGSTPYWRIHEDGRQCEFQGGVNTVLYPELPLRLKELRFSVTPGSIEPLSLSIAIYAEGMKSYLEAFSFPVKKLQKDNLDSTYSIAPAEYAQALNQLNG